MKMCRRAILLIALITALALLAARVAASPASAGPSEPLLIMGPPVAEAPLRVTVQITFTGNGAQISSLLFAVDYDSELLAFDAADADADGVPNTVAVHLPLTFQPVIKYRPANAQAELLVVLNNMMTPLPLVPDGPLMTISFRPLEEGVDVSSAVHFAKSPSPAMGDPAGQAIQATAVEDPLAPAPVIPPKRTTSLVLPGAGVILIILFAMAARRGLQSADTEQEL